VLQDSRRKINLIDAEWCNGSTRPSDGFCLGSSPSSATLRGLFVLFGGTFYWRNEMVKLVSVLAVLLMATVAHAQYPQQQEYAQQGYSQQAFPQNAYAPINYGGGFTPCHSNCNKPQPTICCHKWWDPYAYSTSYWDPCSCSYVICWYGGWKMDCPAPMQWVRWRITLQPAGWVPTAW
jgi:hypothetical protein